MRIACIGLGNMGGHMARNLVVAGFDVVAADLDPLKVQSLADAGAARRAVLRTLSLVRTLS